MEKLSIKNFGPIKDVEIELKKVNIFIGPQEGGKSTIAKVISALRSFKRQGQEEVIATILSSKLMNDFNLGNYFDPLLSKIEFKPANGQNINIKFGQKTTELVLQEPDSKSYRLPESIFIPAERSLVPLIAASSFYFIREKAPIPTYVTDFGSMFQRARTALKSQTFDFLDGLTYSYENGIDKITKRNGKVIILTESSNGMQAIIPLLLVINYITAGKVNINKNIAISIEEPELSLYPETQNEFLKYLLRRIGPLNYNLTITTHSPYTMTALNNLMYAYQVGKKNKKVQNIIPRELWLNPDDVGAWFVENGTVRSIMDTELQQIRAEEIDNVSEILNTEFDKIMDLKFEKGN